MASTDARPVPRKNVAYRVTFPLLDADGDLVTGAAGLDSEVSIDGGTFADCTNEATEIATSSGVYYLDLTAAEMNGDTVAVIVKTSTSGAKTTTIVMYPEEAGDYRADVVQISGDTTAADNAESFFDGTGYAGTNNTIPTVTNVTTVNGLAANVVTATSIAASALNGKGDWNIGKTGYSLTQAFPTNFASLAITVGGAVTAGTVSDKTGYSLTQAFPANFADLAITATTGQVTVGTNNDKTGYSISGTKTTLDALNDLSAAQVNAEVDAALDTAIPAVNTAGSINDVMLDVVNARLLGTVAAGTHSPQSGDSFARLGAPAGSSVSADIAGVQSDTNDIQSRLPAALVGGRMDSNLGAISTSATAADNLERSTLGIVTGTVGTGSTTTSIVTSSLSPAASVADQFKGRIVTFDANTTTAALRGQSTDITANTNTGTLTVTALTTAPASGDTFTIT